ncbi:MAG: hypothetical protein FJY11_00305 [Bacteroidetes bacterium]|nr:hypothetical protein [Bacteroidota bacterium]
MAVLFRIFLIGLLVYLVLRTIASFGARTGPGAQNARPDNKGEKRGHKRRGIPREIGEYVDYEDVD